VPCAPINDVAQTFAEPQVQHRGMAVSAPHPVAGVVPLVRSPLRFSDTPVDPPTAPPLLGQHTETILRERLGMHDERIADLRRRGIV
jgi:crotonobetainyl-CoA:carnitine CoA-transferase CaiB-like acyl-CoA transferase